MSIKCLSRPAVYFSGKVIWLVEESYSQLRLEVEEPFEALCRLGKEVLPDEKVLDSVVLGSEGLVGPFTLSPGTRYRRRATLLWLLGIVA